MLVVVTCRAVWVILPGAHKAKAGPATDWGSELNVMRPFARTGSLDTYKVGTVQYSTVQYCR